MEKRNTDKLQHLFQCPGKNHNLYTQPHIHMQIDLDFFFGHAMRHAGSQFPKQELNPHNHWTTREVPDLSFFIKKNVQKRFSFPKVPSNFRSFRYQLDKMVGSFMQTQSLRSQRSALKCFYFLYIFVNMPFNKFSLEYKA